MKKTMAWRAILALILCCSMIFNVFAATVTETVENEDGTTTVSTTVETTDTEDGKTTVVVTVTSETTGTTAEGVVVSGTQTREETTVTDEDGNAVTSWTESGSETKSWSEEDNGNAAGQVSVTVELKPGETTSNTGVTTEITGDVASGNYTETTTTERVVEATATESEARVEVTGTSKMNPLMPDRTIKDSNMDAEQLIERWTYSDGFNNYKATTAPEGYDYRFTGFGQMSNFYVGTEKAHSGALQFELQYDPDYDPASSDNKVVTPEEIYTAYCADINTDGKDNFWYRIDTLEDAGYYDEESAAHIRAIALNGYWGTSNTPDEDGNYQMGSLAKLKADMIAAVESGELTGITVEEINSITQGQAINATQSAIWMFANKTTDGDYVDPERLAIRGNAKDTPTEQDIKNVEAIFAYLMALEPIERSEGMEVIDQDAFIRDDSMSITVGDKLSGYEENEDDNEDNDVYGVSLNFALVVTPSNENDDLIVQVISGFDADGNPIIAAQGRIAGGNAEEDAANGFHNVIFDAETGTYTLENLQLAENSDFNFDLKLVGTQYLEQGVYIFTSENRDGVTSQTFVSVLEGSKEVNVSKGFVIRFNVNEDNEVVAQRVWNNSFDPELDTPNNNELPGGNNKWPNTPNNNVQNDGETVDIEEEEVPLADVPNTGDTSFVFVIMAILSACGLAYLALTKKRENG